MATIVKVSGFVMTPQSVIDVVMAQGLTVEEVTVDHSALQIRVVEDLDAGEEAALSAAVNAAMFGVTFIKA